MIDFVYPSCKECDKELTFIFTHESVFGDTLRASFICQPCKIGYSYFLNVRTKLQMIHKIT